MVGTGDGEALRKTTQLMKHLAEVTDATERDPVRDILADETGAPDPIVWLDVLPEGIRVKQSPRDDVLLRLRPQRLDSAPRPPRSLDGWVEPAEWQSNGPEPRLVEFGPIGESAEFRAEPPGSVRRAHGTWLSRCQEWERQQESVRRRQQVYEKLERAAKTLEYQDDEFELVLAVGLLRWEAPGDERICRHLITETVVPKLDRDSAEVTVSFASGRRRLEDREVLGGQDGFHSDRGRDTRQAVLDDEIPTLDPALMTRLQEWAGYSLDTPVETTDEWLPSAQALPREPTLSASPALMVRPRSRALLAETYQKIATALQRPDAQVPVALAQLVVDTERRQRDAWLHQQGTVSGDVLGEDPLFPLPTNDEQRRVFELLRSETGIVVQGPPGTGKTHTIANLVSALLARGQRVLVTSQKDQALKVLRQKIPKELRDLCVLLAGGSKDAAKELERGLDALSAAVASPETARIEKKIAFLKQERCDLRSRSAELNERIGTLRGAEQKEHKPMVPGFSSERYRGTLGSIIRELRQESPTHEWFPPLNDRAPDRPPLCAAEALDLLRLLRTDTPVRQERARRPLPEPTDLPTPTALADSFKAEKEAGARTPDGVSGVVERLAGSGNDALRALASLHEEAEGVLIRLGLDQLPSDHWVNKAVADHLGGRCSGLWDDLASVNGQAGLSQERLRARGLAFVVEMRPSISEVGIGVANGMLAAGRELREYLARGGKLRTGRILRPPAVQQRAADFLAVMRVDGRPPATAEQVDAALEHLEAHVFVVRLGEKWAVARMKAPPEGLVAALSEFQDRDRRLAEVRALADLHSRAAKVLRDAGRPTELPTPAVFLRLLRAVPAALDHVALQAARTRVDQLYDQVRRRASATDSCPELGLLLEAITQRDLAAYHHGLIALDEVRADRASHHRQKELAGRLQQAHPQLFAMLCESAGDSVWEARLADLADSWAWAKASCLVRQQRTAEEERHLACEFDEVEKRIGTVTAELAGAEALQACLERMNDNHVRALRTYREHMEHIGAGFGRRTREFRKAARAAMDKAKGAVPAWVVPLPNLLDNIAVEHNAFDVIVVDEASQVGIEHLFLLWMAPRVIVVGDDKQCTPGQNRFGRSQEQIFESLREHLNELDTDVSLHFTLKSHLYGMLSARSGKDAVVRLREHFRCLPEIINWSSHQFYGGNSGGLVALRERTAVDLDPLQVVHVTGAYVDGRNSTIRNEVEAKQIVAQLCECLADPRYKEKTFGIVVLQGHGQIKHLEHKINAAIPAEKRGAHDIRVGSAPNFQGDERDVIFLSTVVVKAPRALTSTTFRQVYNVAASRAKDQLWLFTSVPVGGFKPDDLRASLLDYLHHPPSVYGQSPALEDVSATELVEPFESLFEQRVFRAIRARGYHVVPQHPVGRRRLDLVVVGDGGRLAVECDGHRWHSSLSDTQADARRDCELRRMKWQVLRIRESEFEFDPDRELASLWRRLAERRIAPVPCPPDAADRGSWHPIGLLPDDTPADDPDDPDDTPEGDRP